MSESAALIVGLGNPEEAYKGTRHNIGFDAVQNLAQSHGLDFVKKREFKGLLAKGVIGNDSCLLLMPQTYMNLSGESVKEVVQYFKVDLARILILTDDVAIPFGALRIRINSSSGGHNGLKSIEESLQTNRYARLRIGVGAPGKEDLAEYVLSQFLEEEKKQIPAILKRVSKSVEIWVEEGLTSAMDFANRSSTPSIGDKRDA